MDKSHDTSGTASLVLSSRLIDVIYHTGCPARSSYKPKTTLHLIKSKTYLKVEVDAFDSSGVIDQTDPTTGVHLVSMLQHQTLRHSKYSLVLHHGAQLLPLLAVPSAQ